MDRIKIRASSLIELIMAMLIFSISIAASGIAFVHYRQPFKNKKLTEIKAEQLKFQIIENKYNVRKLSGFENENYQLRYRAIQGIDSVWLVEIYSDEMQQNDFAVIRFFYVQD